MTDIYNIFAGTKCGEITDPSEELIGKRVTNDDYLGTIKYVGPLPGSKSFWLGIDWDNETRGRHSGIFNGVQYFLTTFPTSGSFVRSSKVSLGCSFEEALVYRYSTCAECQLLARNNEPIKMDVTLRQEKVDASAVEKNSGFITLKPAIQLEEAEYEGPNADFISPFHLELFSRPIKDADRHAFCGFAGAEKILTKLRSVTLSQVPVYRALYHTQAAVKESAPPLWPLTGGILGNLLPKLTELDISASTFSRWIDVAELCIQLPWLQSLNVSHNPLRISLDSVSMLPGPSSFPEEVACSFNPQKDCDDTHKLLDPRLHTDILPSQEAAARAEALMHHAFPSVRRLAMVCVKHVNWIRLDRILSWFPALDDLVVAYNPLGDPPPLESAGPHLCATLSRLKSIDLTSTDFSNWSSLLALLSKSSLLASLMLARNRISKLYLPSTGTNNFEASQLLPSLHSIGLAANSFEDWHMADQLARFPSLREVTLSECPVMLKSSNETARQELIARMPMVTVLNRLEVMADEKRGAELDYLKRYGTQWRAAGGDIDSDTGAFCAGNSAFNQLHPAYARLCAKYGPPEVGECKQITRSLRETLISLVFRCQPPSPGLPPNSQHVTLRLPLRITVGHLRGMLRKILRLPSKSELRIVVEDDRSRASGICLELEADTRELGFYDLDENTEVTVHWTE